MQYLFRVVYKVSIDAIVNSIFHSFFHSSGGWEGLSFAFGVLDLAGGHMFSHG